MSYLYIRYFACALILFFTSCKKENQLFYTIQGRIFDPNYNTAIKDAEVKIYAKEISGGTLNGNYVLKKTVKTGLDGSYLMEFERKNVVDYKITVSKPKYFSFESIVKQSSLNVDEVNSYDIDLFPKSVFKISIKNTTPVDENDQIEVYFDQSTSFGCSSCIGKQRITVPGEFVDTTVYGHDWANKELLIQYSVRKNGVYSFNDINVFTSINDTTFVNISY